MAKPQQQQQKFHQHSCICSTSVLLCFIAALLLCCGIASGSGSGNTNAGNHNHTEAMPPEQRIRRDVTGTEEQQQKLPVAKSAGEPEEPPDHQSQMSQSNYVERISNSPYKELNLFKRAPNGFIGMRGKKINNDDDDDYFNPNPMDWSLDPLFHHTDDNAIDGDDADYAENLRYKKAPIAFYGVRGKKIPNQLGNNNILNEILQQAEEESLRDRMLQDFLDRLAVATAAQNEINKRAPTGFTGLRGKRPANWIDLEDKLRPVNAFHGVGVKEEMGNQEEPHQALFKRSPSESLAGKRRLSEFNNKFVAVRGKKATAMDGVMDDASDVERKAAAQFIARQRLRFLAALLPAFIEQQYAKRAPNGFIGMRGKRAAGPAPPSAENQFANGARTASKSNY